MTTASMAAQGTISIFGGVSLDAVGTVAVGNDIIDGGAGNDTVDGGDGNDVLHGSGGNDSVTGSAGDDIVYGDAGDNTLDGGAVQRHDDVAGDDDKFHQLRRRDLWPSITGGDGQRHHLGSATATTRSAAATATTRISAAAPATAPLPAISAMMLSCRRWQYPWQRPASSGNDGDDARSATARFTATAPDPTGRAPATIYMKQRHRV